MDKRSVIHIGIGLLTLMVLLTFLMITPSPIGAVTYYWGTDTNKIWSNALPANREPQNFYIGQAGGPVIAQSDAQFIAAATAAGYYNTYIYWTLTDKVSGVCASDPYKQGQNQADAIIYEYLYGRLESYIGGRVMFADIEQPNYWCGTSANQQVINGFLDRVKSRGYTPGIYTSSSQWSTIMGSASWTPSQKFVFWITGVNCGYSVDPVSGKTYNKCDPTHNQFQLSEVYNKFVTAQSTWVGGQTAVIWQYWYAGDFDITQNSPSAGWTPRN